MNSNPSATNSQDPKSPEPTASRIDSESLVRHALDDVALIVASAAGLRQLDDDLVWTVLERLDRVRIRLLRDLRGLSSNNGCWPTPPEPSCVHPAVEEFLFRNRTGLGE
jgi:hypothetical protein